MRILIPVLLTLLGITPHVHAQPPECEACCDLYFVLTCSDTMVELPQLMGGAREGLRDLFTRIRTTGSGCRPRVSLCCYGTTADEQITPDGPLNADLIQMVGGISRLDLGIECARASSQANRRTGVGQTMVLIVGEDPLGFGTDDFTDASREQIRLARNESFARITLTTVSENVYGDLIQDFADDGFWIDIQPDFREFERRSRLGPGDVDLWQQRCCPTVPVDGEWGTWGQWTQCSVTCGPGRRSRRRGCTRPTPSNGGRNCEGNAQDQGNCNLRDCATAAPPPPGVCDNCLIIQGIGYRHVDGECRKFIVCFFDGSDPPFMIKWTALGTFWDTPQVEQHWPKNVICDWDPCTSGGRSLTAWEDERNCAGYWECADIDGIWRTFEWKCCEADEYWDDPAKQCRPDNNNVCDTPCPPLDPTTPPFLCPMDVRTDERFYFDTRDPDAEDRACAEGMLFSVASCTCEGLPVEDPCGPVFHLTFDGGNIVDLSRNHFWIHNVGGVTTAVDASGNWYGVFDGNSQLFVPGLSNFDLMYNWAFVIDYDGENNSNNNRVALIGSINCGRPEGPYYVALVNPTTLEAFILTDSGPTNMMSGTIRVSVPGGGMNHVVYLYRNATGLDLRVDPGGIEGHFDIDGSMWRIDKLCAFQIGFGKKWGFFNGKIYEVIVYRDPDCIPDVL